MASKRLKINHNGDTYTLEFTKRSVRALEAKGFDTKSLLDGSFTMHELLIEGAFFANHRGLRSEKIAEIIADTKDTQGLIAKLVGMYMEPLEGLYGGDVADDEKNATWEEV